MRVNLLGRYMLADRREFPCQVVNMSPGGMALIAPVAGAPGERVIAYVDHLGRLEGQHRAAVPERLRDDDFGHRRASATSSPPS